MSGYRNYVPWNKSSSTSYSGSAKTPSSVSIPKFEKNLGRNSTESIKTPTSRIASRYGTTYSAGVQQDISSPSTAGYNARCDNSRKKDTSHPPVSYRPLPRTGSRSRDPSPVDKSEKSASSSSSYDYNRLYPKTYQRSVSRERTESTGSSTTIPKYYGRNSSNEFEAAKYTGKSTITKDEIPRRLSVSKDETSPSSRYKIPSRTTSREDLSSGSQKYIKSRFLPKNSVEKSQTAYSKSSSAKTNEVSRRNRELLNALHVQQEQERLSRPTSRCSSVTPEECFVKQISSSSNSEGKSAPKRELEMEAVTMISRGTSPIQESIPGYLKTRRAEGAQIIEKKIVRPKKPVHTMVDKGIQSEKSEEPTRILRYTKPSTTSATPWSSFLDMKFSSPNSKQKSSIKSDNKAQISTKNSGSPDSSKSLSRSSSTKSLANVQSSQNDKPKDVKKSPSPSKSRIVPPKQIGDKKQLPPQIPKSESPSKSCHSTNKDFRKSVLNMNPTGKPNSKQLSRRSHSASSADSEVADPDATDVSENLTSCRSYHDSCSSKLPKKTTPEKARRSSSREASIASTTSGSEDDMQTRKDKKKNNSTGSSRTSMVLSSADEQSQGKASKPPQSPWTKGEGNRSEADVKSFLMKAFAPVTNLFKAKPHAHTENVNWMDSSADESDKSKVDALIASEQNPAKMIGLKEGGITLQPTQAKIVIQRVESGEKPWWMDSDNSDQKGKSSPSKISENSCQEPLHQRQNLEMKPTHAKIIIHRVESGEKPWWMSDDSHKSEQEAPPPPGNNSLSVGPSKIRHVPSGELPWWLDEKGEVPEGVVTYPKYEADDAPTDQAMYKVRRNNSADTSWWLTSSEKTTSDSNRETSKNAEQDHWEKYKIRHIDSGERAWWLSSSENISEMVQAKEDDREIQPKYAIRHQDSGEKPWWLHQDVAERNTDDQEVDDQAPLGDRASPEGLEMSKDDEESSDNVSRVQNKSGRANQMFISRHTNIDEILGGSIQIWSPQVEKMYEYGNEPDRSWPRADGTKVHTSSYCGNSTAVIPRENIPQEKLDDAALQLYKDGDYGSYLDLEASISEQQEEFEGFQSNKKNSLVLRTQLSVRVHTIIEKLLTSEGRELRRALFSLKQIFQEDKDLVHEFVQNDGLSCLIKVGSEADQNYQNYILRALGQVMLYVDGMNGVMEHNPTIQWLYSLISSKFRLVVKTALKLLLVFVEYTDSNCLLLIKAINAVDYAQGVLAYHNLMRLLKDFDSADTELLIYAMTLINKILNGVSDQDTYYDQTDLLEEQGLEGVIQRYMSKPGTDLDLLQQFQIYEAVLQYEDGEDSSGTPMRHLDESIRKMIRNRKLLVDSTERRKSRRHSTGNSPMYTGLTMKNNNNLILQINREDEDDESSSSQSSGINSNLNGSYKDSNKVNYANTNYQQRNSNNVIRNSSRKDLTPLMNAVNILDSEEKQPWIYSMMKDQENAGESESTNNDKRNVLLQLKRENTVKDLTQKLANQNILHSPSEENKINRIGDMSGLISKAKEGLAKSKSKADVLKSPTSENIPKSETKKSENELRWEELIANLNRSLNLCDMDFTDLASDDEVDILAPVAVANGVPPPPPPLADLGSAPPPPPLSYRINPPSVPSPPVFGVSLQRPNRPTETKIPIKKNKKTVKLFWKEVRDDSISHMKLKTGFIWDELAPVCVDTQKLEHLFESRAKDLITKKQQEMNKNKEIIVLDPKRSNAINIGMTKLPPPRSIKTAILKMDATIMNREGIEKLLTMLPTEEERTKIQEAQAANPDLPLGSAEQFLLTLASISELTARLKLWAFKLDFENSEREIAEPLMDLKQGIEVLRANKTFRGILSTLLSIGNFLNGNEVRGFQIEYLAKVPEVKDTVHKHSLLHHLCHIVMEKFPDATDLYSEIGAITRASKIDFDELALNVQRLKADCKASWDHLKLIAKHDGSTMMKVKMSDFLSDCAERIILLEIIHRRILNRFHKFLLWLGIPLHQIAETKPNEFCRIVSEFALEYRTTRERVLQQLEKKANHRERNKTRGKMITDVGKFRTKEDKADAELRTLLGSDLSDVESMQGTLPWRRTRRDGNRSFMSPANGNLTDGDDEILESLVKSATKATSTRTTPRERKRTRHADRKSLKRSRTRENNPFGSRDSP